MRSLILSFFWLSPFLSAAVSFDVTAVRPGPVKVSEANELVSVEWNDKGGRAWQADFSLNPATPLIAKIGPKNGKPVMQGASPLYDCEVGKRRGGWDEFFDFPPSHPEGTRRFPGVFKLTAASAKTSGDRLQLFFDGLTMGPFTGKIAFTIFPGSQLIQQEALVSTKEPDTAFYYNAGIRTRSAADVGEVMNAQVSYYDTAGQFQTVRSTGPERIPLKVRHRALSLRTDGGAIVAFPPPHQYFMPRDFTSNMGFTWHSAWRGFASIGIKQHPDDNWRFYPWMNAPPGTEQRLSIFYLLDDRDAKTALASVLPYTHGDRFQKLDGFKTLASHWHFNFTVQAMQNGMDWTPPFKPVLKQMGVDVAMIMDFHGDGHPGSLEDIRLKELEAMHKASRSQSDSEFLIIPGEEANVWLGGHYCLTFPKPVYWFMKRPAGKELKSADPRYGTVWHTGSAQDLFDLIKSEGGYVYQAHPRTKSSKGYPDKIRDADYFKSEHFIGAGWKAMPADLSSPRLGERAFKTIDDANNWGARKLFMGEADVFQLDSTHELYAHMNVNYVRIPKLPSYDNYGEILKAAAAGDSFITTGEILLPEVSIKPDSSQRIAVNAKVSWTFPLRMMEVVWGNGSETFHKTFSLEDTPELSAKSFDAKIEAPGWKWARFAVWDVAGNGAFTQPVWSDGKRAASLVP